MRHNHAQDDAIEGFDESDLPAMGPGGIAGAYDRKLAPEPPRLCEVGPCVHYHRFAIQLDAEGPKAASVLAGGKLEGAPPEQPFHVRVHHYCYPDVGIETELGSMPVMQCNRWSPMPPSQAAMIATRNSEFFANDPRGQKYVEEMQAWESARDAELEAEAEDPIATWATVNLRDGDYVDVCPANDDNAPPFESCDADSARAFLTNDYLKERYGVRSVRLELWRPKTGESPELVQTITVEVQ